MDGEITHPASGGYVLKHNDAFSILGATGDIRSEIYSDHGLYLNDCRHLSRFELRLGTMAPLLLATNLSQDGSLMMVDLANTDIQSSILQQAISREKIHLLRQVFLWDDVLHQTLKIQSFSDRPIWFMVEHIYDADFRDMFEIRGTARNAAGEVAPVVINRSSATLRYLGRDGCQRSTSLLFDPEPSRVTPSAAFYQLQINGGERLALHTCVVLQQTESAQPSQALKINTAHHYRAMRRHHRSERATTPYVISSNALFNQWLQRSIGDLHNLLSETSHGVYPYAGIPWFNAPFGRDGLITALEALQFEPRIARGVLSFLAAKQASTVDDWNDAAPGKILHEARRGEMARMKEVPFAQYYGSVDSTPLFVVLAEAYLQRSGDHSFLAQLWPNIRRALDWIDTSGVVEPYGFTVYQCRGDSGLVNQGWKDSGDSIAHADGTLATAPIALCEVQAYVYAAKRAAAKLALEFASSEMAERLDQQADKLATAFEQHFWDASLQFYVLALDGENAPCRVKSSNAGHTLFTRLASPSKAKAIVKALSSKSMNSGWGIRTLSTEESWYSPLAYHNGSVWPHDNALIAMGMAAYGYREEPLAILTGLFDASLSMPLQRLPELFCGFSRRRDRSPVNYAEACSPQAWSSASVYGLLSAVLGLTIDALSGQVRVAKPVLPNYLEVLEINALKVGNASVDLLFERTHNGNTTVVPTRLSGDVELVVTA